MKHVIKLLACLLFPLVLQAQEPYTVLFLGDSLTAGYGLDGDDSFPAMLDRRFQDEDRNIRVLNGGVSGATSASGLSRLQWYVRSGPDLVLIALGANDGLRGLSVDEMKSNLRRTIEFARQNAIEVALAGMLIPPNYGPAYTQAFAQVFPDLAEEYQLPYMPFLLEGVAAETELNQADGIHPNLEGTRMVADMVYDFLQPLLP
jgi:acyl-CoA thioesterase I